MADGCPWSSPAPCWAFCISPAVLQSRQTKEGTTCGF
nr:MAG TPA: hypothetical protein [Caudoviricetes sp.]